MGDILRQKIGEAIVFYLSSVSDLERVETINFFRDLIHKFSHFQNQSIYFVIWIKDESLAVNSYNPNNVAPQENKLLLKYIENDGFTQPLVV